jgi:hypothetical protein
MSRGGAHMYRLLKAGIGEKGRVEGGFGLQVHKRLNQNGTWGIPRCIRGTTAHNFIFNMLQLNF